MPVITYVGGIMDSAVKSALIRELTQTASRVSGTPAQFMTVIIDEHDDTNIGLGGETLVDFKARWAKQNKG